jgi:hypothetical protein
MKSVSLSASFKPVPSLNVSHQSHNSIGLRESGVQSKLERQPQFGYGPQTDNTGVYLLAGLSALFGIPILIGAALFSFAKIPPTARAVETVQVASQTAPSSTEFKAALLAEMPKLEAGLKYVDEPFYQELKTAGAFDINKIGETVDQHWPVLQKYLKSDPKRSETRKDQMVRLLMEISPDKDAAIQAKGTAERLVKDLEQLEDFSNSQTFARLITGGFGLIMLMLLISALKDRAASKAEKPAS